MPARSEGFTLIEVLIVIVVLAIIISLGVPSFVDALDKRRVINATKALTSQVQQARSLAILLNRPVILEIGGQGANWCFGITDRTQCDCTSAGNADDAGVCSVDRPEGGARMVVRGTSNAFPGITLADPSAASRLIFEPTRGVRVDGSPPDVAYIFSSARNRQTAVRVNVIGKASACAVDEVLLGGLKKC